MATLTEEEMREIVDKSKPTTIKEVDEIPNDFKHRNILVVGCGDGGCMIASHIRKEVPGTTSIGYNTSSGAMSKMALDHMVYPNGEDGSGKARSYSKDVFKKDSHKFLLGNVQTCLHMHDKKFSYVIVTTTVDGGTGSGVSPMVSKLLMDNIDVPVILLGVYPSLTEDAAAQYNALEWQSEVEKIHVPYMIFDNNIPGMPKGMVHQTVNNRIASCLKIITGDIYGASTISSIDTKDLLTLLEYTGERIVLGTTTKKPVTGQSLDDFIEKEILSENNQPKPCNMQALGVFVKGPKAFLDGIDVSLVKLCETYGNVAVKHTHIQEDEQIQISVIMSGCTNPAVRLFEIRSRYDDIQAAQAQRTSTIGDLMKGIDSPKGVHGTEKKESATPNLSALDL